MTNTGNVEDACMLNKSRNSNLVLIGQTFYTLVCSLCKKNSSHGFIRDTFIGWFE